VLAVLCGPVGLPSAGERVLLLAWPTPGGRHSPGEKSVDAASSVWASKSVTRLLKYVSA
jgi:hypothetical protein